MANGFFLGGAGQGLSAGFSQGSGFVNQVQAANLAERQLGQQQQRLDLEEQRIEAARKTFSAEQKAALREEAGKDLADLEKQFKEMAAAPGFNREQFQQTLTNPESPTSKMIASLEDRLRVSGVNINRGDVSGRILERISLTPTPKQAATAEGEASAAGTMAEVEALSPSVGRERAEVAAGVPAAPTPPNQQVVPFQMPDGSVIPVNMRDTGTLNSVMDAGGIPTPRSLQATTAGDLTGVSPENIEVARESIEQTSQQLASVENTAQAFRDNPSAGGLFGSIIENVGGVLQQFSAGQQILDQAGVDPAKVKEVRTKARIVVSQMLETITGETSGRFTDTERKIASEVVSALSPTSSPEQIESAFKTVQDIMKPALMRDSLKLLDASKADINTEEGQNTFLEILISNGMTADQAADIASDIIIQREGAR